MTIAQLHYDFKMKLDKVDSMSREDFNPAEIDWLLYEASWVWVKNRYGQNNPKQSGFETSQKRITDLANLHVTYPEQPPISATKLNNFLFEVNLSSFEYEYFLLTKLDATITKGSCTKQAYEIKEIQTDDLQEFLRDPFNKPNFNEGVIGYNFSRSGEASGTNENPAGKGSIKLYSDGTFDITYVIPSYLKYPRRVWLGNYDLTSDLRPKDGNNTYIYQSGVDDPVGLELDSSVHNEIVDFAVMIAAGIIENPAYVQLKEKKAFTSE